MIMPKVDEMINKNENVLILVIGKDTLLGNFAMSVFKKISKNLNLKNTTYNVMEVDDENINEPLPVLFMYKNKQLINKLLGFHSSIYYTNWIKENVKNE